MTLIIANQNQNENKFKSDLNKKGRHKWRKK